MIPALILVGFPVALVLGVLIHSVYGAWREKEYTWAIMMVSVVWLLCVALVGLAV